MLFCQKFICDAIHGHVVYENINKNFSQEDEMLPVNYINNGLRFCALWEIYIIVNKNKKIIIMKIDITALCYS